MREERKEEMTLHRLYRSEATSLCDLSNEELLGVASMLLERFRLTIHTDNNQIWLEPVTGAEVVK